MVPNSGTLDSETTSIAVPKPLGTNAPLNSGIVPLLRSAFSIAAIVPLLRTADCTGIPPLLIYCSCGAPRLPHTFTQHNQNTNTTSSHIMPCAAGELCKLADVELIAPNGRACGHECRGGCGGKLHGICSEVEDPDGDSPSHRICHTCISKQRSLSNPAKRKQGQGSQGFVLPGAATKKPRASGATKPRKRLNLGEKLEVLDMSAYDKLSEEPDSDEEEELGDTGEIESAGGRKLVAPPLYTELSGFFGPLEQVAQSAGNTEAGHFLRKAKMSFLAAHAAKPVRQADMRMFLEP